MTRRPPPLSPDSRAGPPDSRMRGETGYHRREHPCRPVTTVTDASRQRHPPTP
ncbi:hypothetical protein OH687_10755 [Burkholderia anthina]|nr:hypothetical protein OH687_10755 [Burkholderia anthina]